MWKLPFYILEAEAYSEQIFSSHDECIEKYGPAIEEASRQLDKKRMKAGRFLIFRHQVIALPPSHFDQRLLGVADLPGADFGPDRPKTIVFEN